MLSKPAVGLNDELADDDKAGLVVECGLLDN